MLFAKKFLIEMSKFVKSINISLIFALS